MKNHFPFLNISFLFALTGLLIACGEDEDCIVPSEKVISEQISLGAFNKVVMLGEADMYFSKDSAYRVVIRGSDNIVPQWESFVTDSTLFLQPREGVCLVGNDVSFGFWMPELKGVGVVGQSNILMEGIQSDRLDLYVEGYSNTRIDTSEIKNLNILYTGAGNVYAYGANADSVEVNVAGEADVEVSVAQYLWVRVTGRGNVIYSGNPIIDQSILGSGSVKQRK